MNVTQDKNDRQFTVTNGGRYKVKANLIGTLGGKTHFTLHHRDDGTVLVNKTISEEEFVKLFREEAGERILRLRIDAIHPKTNMVHFTAINQGGVPYPGEHSWPLALCQNLFCPFN